MSLQCVLFATRFALFCSNLANLMRVSAFVLENRPVDSYLVKVFWEFSLCYLSLENEF